MGNHIDPKNFPTHEAFYEAAKKQKQAAHEAWHAQRAKSQGPSSSAPAVGGEIKLSAMYKTLRQQENAQRPRRSRSTPTPAKPAESAATLSKGLPPKK